MGLGGFLKLLRSFNFGQVAVEGAQRQVACFAGRFQDQAIGKT
jgi:hypothetical protein